MDTSELVGLVWKRAIVAATCSIDDARYVS
jgi:hypothetical protein